MTSGYLITAKGFIPSNAHDIPQTLISIKTINEIKALLEQHGLSCVVVAPRYVVRQKEVEIPAEQTVENAIEDEKIIAKAQAAE